MPSRISSPVFSFQESQVGLGNVSPAETQVLTEDKSPSFSSESKKRYAVGEVKTMLAWYFFMAESSRSGDAFSSKIVEARAYMETAVVLPNQK